MNTLTRSSLFVTIITTIGLGLGLLSQIVIASKFGAKSQMDVYLASTSVPLLITSILSSALNFTFIPLFADYRSNNSENVWRIVSSFLNLMLVGTLIFSSLGIIFAPNIIRTITPGFSSEQIVDATEMLRWLFPIIILTTINELMAGVYYSNQRFLLPSLGKIIGPVCTIIYVLLFYESMSTKSIIFAILSSAALQSAIFMISFARNREYKYFLELDIKHPGTVKIVRLMLPLILGMLVYRSIPIFDRFVLSFLPEGSIATLGYSNTLVSSLTTVIISGIATVIFPRFSDYYTTGNIELLKQKLDEVLRLLVFCTVPIMTFVAIHSFDIVRIMFERGSFDHRVTANVADILLLHISTLLPATAGTILGQCFYASQNMRIAAILGSAEALFYMVICFPLTFHFGLKGLIYATVIDWWLSLYLTVTFVGKVTGWDPKNINLYFAKIVLISSLLVVLLLILKFIFVPWMLAGLIFTLSYYYLTWAFSMNAVYDLVKI